MPVWLSVFYLFSKLNISPISGWIRQFLMSREMWENFWHAQDKHACMHICWHACTLGACMLKTIFQAFWDYLGSLRYKQNCDWSAYVHGTCMQPCMLASMHARLILACTGLYISQFRFIWRISVIYRIVSDFLMCDDKHATMHRLECMNESIYWPFGVSSRSFRYLRNYEFFTGKQHAGNHACMLAFIRPFSFTKKI